MAREAREKKLFSTYYIKQTCPDRQIFKNEDDRIIFIDTIVKVKDKYNFKLYKLCIHPEGYEMIVYDNGSDISKIMKSINISFAMQYKCQHEACKTVFKERYKSRILQACDVLNEINTLPTCLYASQDLFDDYEANTEVKDCLDCKEKAKSKLLQLLAENQMTMTDMLKNKKYRNQLIKQFRQDSVLSLSELGILFGGLSESAISKILSR